MKTSFNFFTNTKAEIPATAVIVAFATLMVCGLIVGFLVQAGDQTFTNIDDQQSTSFWSKLQNFGFATLILATLGILIMSAMFILNVLQDKGDWK